MRWILILSFSLSLPQTSLAQFGAQNRKSQGKKKLTTFQKLMLEREQRHRKKADELVKREDYAGAIREFQSALNTARGLRLNTAQDRNRDQQRLNELRSLKRQLDEENALRQKAKELEKINRLDAAIKTVEEAMRVRKKRLKYRAVDREEDRRRLVQLRNALNTQLSEGVSLHEEYRDRWFDRKLEFHSGGKMAAEINSQRKLYQSLAARRGLQDPDVVAADKKLKELVANREKAMKELVKDSQFRDSYFIKGEFGQASFSATQAMKRRRQIYGEADITVAVLSGEEARMAMRQGLLRPARAAYQQALKSTKLVFGEKHWRVRDVEIGIQEVALLSNLSQDFRKKYVALRFQTIRCQRLIQTNNLFDAEPAARENLAAADALRFTNRTAPRTTLIAALINMAAVYRGLGRFSDSVPLQRRAIGLVQEIYGEAHPHSLDAWAKQFEAYMQLRDFDQARRAAQQARDICVRVWKTNGTEYADSLLRLAQVLNASQRHREAANILRPAIDIAEKNRSQANAKRYIRYVHELAVAFLGAGRAKRARELLEHARRFQDPRDSAEFISTLDQLARAHLANGDPAAAEKIFREAVQHSSRTTGKRHPDHARLQARFARALWHQKKFAEAEKILSSALTLMRRNLDETFTVMSERQQIAMTRDAYRMLSDYVSLAHATKQPNDKLYGNLLKWKGAILGRQQSLRTLPEDPELAKLLQQLEETNRQFAALSLSRTALPPETVKLAMTNLEATKERLESELSARGAKLRRVSKGASPNELQQALPENVAFVDFYEYTALPKPGQAVAAKPVDARRLLAFVLRHGQPLQTLDLGSLAPITAASESWRLQITRRQGGVASRGLRVLKTDGDKMQLPQQTLRRLLWEPVEKLCGKNSTILISPDGAISRVPFAALPGREAGRYLIEERALAIVPVPSSLPAILGSEKKKTTDHSLLLVGAVDFAASPGQFPRPLDKRPATSSPDKPANLLATRQPSVGRTATRAASMTFSPLPGTAREVEEIALMHRQGFSQARRLEVRGSHATESTFRRMAPQYQYLHLATHGFFAATTASSADVALRHPGLLSGIVLAGANRGSTSKKDDDASESVLIGDDGVFTALEVASLDLRNTELAVLSACETGLGKSASGEGVLGLQRAFQAAGAKSTVTSLWAVDDSATQTLMVEFYRNLWSGNGGKLAALRAAQRSMLERYDPTRRQLKPRGLKVLKSPSKSSKQRLSPYYWSAFVLSGDWR